MKIPPKIYFSGSIRGGREDQELYGALIRLLRKHGEVLTEHVGAAGTTGTGESGARDDEIYERDMEWLAAADVLVAEVTTPSLGVGYEIARMEHLGRPVLCLYRELPDRKPSAMIAGNPNLVFRRYVDRDDLIVRLDEFFSSGMIPGAD